MPPNHGDAGDEKVAGSTYGNNIIDPMMDARATSQPHDSRLYKGEVNTTV